MHGLELAGKPDSSIELDRDDGAGNFKPKLYKDVYNDSATDGMAINGLTILCAAYQSLSQLGVPFGLAKARLRSVSTRPFVFCNPINLGVYGP